MSILIKGLALPNNCHMCFFGFGGFCDVAPAEEDGICPPQGRPTWCPLIELPPHGDLIDRDALMKDGWLSLHKEVMRMGGYAIHELPLINPTIPVVIEREDD